MSNLLQKMKVPIHRLQCIAIVCCLFFSFELSAQNFSKQPRYQASPPFIVKAYNYKDSDEENRLELFLNINKNLLTFIKEGDKYTSRFYLSILLYEKEGGRLIQEKTWQKEIVVSDYDETIAKDSPYQDHLTLHFPAEPYRLVLKLIDMETHHEYSVQSSLNSLQYSKEGIAISSLMLLSKEAYDSTGRRLLIPSFSTLLNQDSANFIDVFFEIYNRESVRDSVNIKYEYWLTGNQEVVVHQLSSSVKLRPKITNVFHRVDLMALNGGDYLLKVFVQDSGENSLAHSEVRFRLRMKGMVSYISNLDEAIQQLEYITNYDEIKPILEAKSREEKLKNFKEFWKKRDPTPNTEVNELMAEYYSRVSYANQHFTNYMKGWRTDMGMIYIKYGAPDFVERHPNSFNNHAYEVWEFHQHRRRFIFIDINGFGDYRLSHPEWDERNRMY